MPTPLRRRIVRRAVMAVAGIVLMVSGYLATCWLAWWTDALPPPNRNTSYVPLLLYEQSDLPGCAELETMTLWCAGRGRRPFGEIYEQRSEFRQLKNEFREAVDELRAESSTIETDTQEPADPQE